jgi:hypothetical protein
LVLVRALARVRVPVPVPVPVLVLVLVLALVTAPVTAPVTVPRRCRLLRRLTTLSNRRARSRRSSTVAYFFSTWCYYGPFGLIGGRTLWPLRLKAAAVRKDY